MWSVTSIKRRNGGKDCANSLMAAGRFLQKSGKFMTVVDNSMQILMFNKALVSYQVTLATDMVLNSYAITCITEQEMEKWGYFMSFLAENAIRGWMLIFFLFFFFLVCITAYIYRDLQARVTCLGLVPQPGHFLWCAVVVWSLWFCGVGALCAGASSILGDGQCTARLQSSLFHLWFIQQLGHWHWILLCWKWKRKSVVECF